MAASDPGADLLRPEEEAMTGGRWLSAAPEEEQVCITGLSGAYPESENVRELRDNLLNGVDMVTTGSRWGLSHPLLPERCGRIKNVEKFDAGFFGLDHKQTNVMAPIVRLLLEKTFEAIVDAGVNPAELKGTRTGVFLSSWTAEAESTWMYEDLQPKGLVLTGTVNTSWATRISYWLQVNGPSRVVDTACSGSSYALDHAYQAMRDGRIDQAIVGGATMLLNPNVSIAFTLMGSMSLKGRSKTFDNGADGYARSEAVVVAFVQRRRDAKRIYASIVHSKTNNDGFKPEGIAYPSGQAQQKLLEEFYRECRVDPDDVAWVEAHGTGTKVGDPEEVNAVTNVFCKNRSTPLPIGSLKTNIGHTEAVSGLCSLSKVIIAMETGLIPPTLHYETPRQGIPGLFDGRLKVITETTPWQGGLVGVSSFGFGGGNSHFLLRSHGKEKVDGGLPKDNTPRLVVVSGRTEEACGKILDELLSRPVDVEFVRLLHDVFSMKIPGHPYRAFALVNTLKPCRHITKAPNVSSPIWFVFPENDSNWTPLGSSLMAFPPFSKSIEKCNQLLQQMNFDLLTLLNRKKLHKNTHALTCMTAIQIGLVDLLGSIRLLPDGIVGKSTGVARYASGESTAEETLQSAYRQGQLLDLAHRDSYHLQSEVSSPKILSSKPQQNGTKYTNGNVIHSTSEDQDINNNEISEFTKWNKKQNIQANSQVHKNLQNTNLVNGVVDKPKPTTIISPAQAERCLPGNVILINFSTDTTSVEKLARSKKHRRDFSLMNGEDISLETFLATIGSLYEAGVELELAPLYPRVSYPVSRGTPMISPLIGWNHTQDWFVFSLAKYFTYEARENFVEIDVTYTDFIFYTNHVIDGRMIFPATGYLTLVWEVLASVEGIRYTDTPAVFEDIRFLRATSTPKEGKLMFVVMIQKVTGKFEVAEGGEAVVTGRVYIPDDVSKEFIHPLPPLPPPSPESEATEKHLPPTECATNDVSDSCGHPPITGVVGGATVGTPTVSSVQSLAPMSTEGGAVGRLPASPVQSSASTSSEGGSKATPSTSPDQTSFKPCTDEKEMEDDLPPTPTDIDTLVMSGKDVYKELRLRGYHYKSIFKSIIAADPIRQTAKILWQDNWIAFMDNVLQTHILGFDTRGLFVPTGLERMCIDPRLHKDMLEAQGPEFQISFVPELSVVRCGGIECRGVQVSAISRRKPMADPVLENYLFLPNTTSTLTLQQALQTCVHMGLENQPMIRVKSVEVVDEETDLEKDLLSSKMATILGNLPLVQAEIRVLSKPDNPLTKDLGQNIKVEDTKLSDEENCLFVLGTNILEREDILKVALACTKNKGFVISREGGEKRSREGSDPRRSQSNAVGDGRRSEAEVGVALARCAGEEGGAGGSGQTEREGGSEMEPCEEGGDSETSAIRVDILCEYPVGNERIVLARKSVDDRNYLVVHVHNDDFSWIPELQAAIRAHDKNTKQKIVLVAQDEPLNGLQGLYNCLRKESGHEHLRCVIVLDPSAPVFDPQLPLYSEQLSKNMACNVYHRGRWGTYRHLALEGGDAVEADHAYINVTSRGDLSSLRWIQGAIKPDSFVPSPDHDLVHVYYASLNFRDIMLASGKLSTESVLKDRVGQDCVLGFEFVGRDSSGRRVMGMSSAGCLANLVAADRELIWEIPEDWSMEDAATVPVTYATALYAFGGNDLLRPGDSLLVHAGSGGVGQAAIHIALLGGCTVYTTVGSREKREFLKERFPQLTDRHIGNSRDASFEQLVMAETGGRGVDVVLNCLTGELLQASLRCLAVGGRFLEIGKVDMVKNTLIGLEDMISKGVSVHGILLDLFSASTDMKQFLHSLLQKAIQEGLVQPLTRTVFGADEIEKAFRFMASGKHIGKVLLQIRDEESQLTMTPDVRTCSASPRFHCNPHDTYIIVGGLGGVGLELADWLVLRGARQLVLTSRVGVRTGYQSGRLRAWRSHGVTVRVSTDDVTTAEGTEQLLRGAGELGTVDAIFNLAVVLKDATFDTQTIDTFTAAFAPKATVTLNLDRVSRRLCPALRYFVVFSSVSCGRGNAGQTNYGMANGVMERVCERRAEEGLPGLAVQWGAVGDVGLVADMMDEHKELVIGGTLQQSISSCLQVLDTLLNQSHPLVSSMVVAAKRSGGAGSLLEYVASMLGIKDIKSVSGHLTLAELGIDSLLVVEMKQALEQEYEVILTPREIRAMTFDRLAKLAETGFMDCKQQSNFDWDIGAFRYLLRALQDEGSATIPTMALPSLATAAQPGGRVFMLPGVEGMAAVLEPLARMTSHRVTGLQLVNKGEGIFRDTIQGIAELILPHVTNTLSPGEPFHLVGYSFGGVVCIYLAELLERGGHRGQAIILDSSPEFFRSVLINKLDPSGGKEVPQDDYLQTNFLAGLLNYLKQEEHLGINEKVHADISQQETWDGKVSVFLSLLPSAEYSRSYTGSLVTAVWSRVKSVLRLGGEGLERRLQSTITLVRPQHRGIDIERDYGLGKYTDSPVEVHMVGGDHASIIESAEVAAIINKAVDDFCAAATTTTSQQQDGGAQGTSAEEERGESPRAVMADNGKEEKTSGDSHGKTGGGGDGRSPLKHTQRKTDPTGNVRSR